MKHDHVCVITSDAEKLMSWYKDKLGFEFIQEWTVEAMPGLQLTYIGRDDFKIEIVGNVPTTEKKGNALENFSPGYNHFAITVEDIESTLEGLKQKGVEVAAPVMQLPQAGIKAAIITDLDGNIIEFIEKIA
ncbi:hypothetical protein BKI52_22000 [marine bacterium AO1-C]|nr:hypothetical protein BKI52_22000 [marine bacterium AO1-C]